MGLTKRKDGWYVEFPVVDDGKVLQLARGTPGAKVKRWKTSTANKTLAGQQEAKIKTDLMMGKLKSAHGPGQLSFKALAKTYLEASTVTCQRTYNWKKGMIQDRLIPEFGSLLLSQITPLRIERYRDKRMQDKGYGNSTLKPATANRSLALLKVMFSLAVREGWMPRNPVSLVKFAKENNARDRVLTAEEFARLQAYSAPHLQGVNLCAYQTGMRLGEILGLTWDRVDFPQGVICLRPEDTKTKEARVVPMTPELTSLLKTLYKVRYLGEDHVFLVKGKSVGAIKTAFNAACRRAQIQGFRFHDFRHTAVTNMRRAGIDHLTIMRISGHKTMEVFKRYNSFHHADLREAASRFNTYLTLAHSRQLTDSPNSLTIQPKRP
ncbi:MAG: site-specific integrase [Nitrospira sp.]|nr:site-specific integrase [Nitrospira sp.]